MYVFEGPVGGIAELPEVATTPLETPDSSVPSVGLIAGVAATVAEPSSQGFARRNERSRHPLAGNGVGSQGRGTHKRATLSIHTIGRRGQT